jgi:hypothetical protein
MTHRLDVSAGADGQAPLNPLDTDIQSHIGRQLRSLYDSVVSQPVPERFHELLSQLEAKVGPGTAGQATAPQPAAPQTEGDDDKASQ